MKTKIEPGRKALIIGAKHKESASLIGRTVRVLCQPSTFEPVPGVTSVRRSVPWPKDAWFIEAMPGDPPLLVAVTKGPGGELVRMQPNRVACIRERLLMRIDGDETPEDVSTAHTNQLEKTA
jgi:hypothetical protein